MSGGVVFSDPVAPRGHVKINQFYLNHLASASDYLYVGSDLLKSYDTFNMTVNCFNEKKLSSSRFLHWFYTLLISISSVYRAYRNRSTVVFFSYDISNLFLVTYLAGLLGVKIKVFEHNTAPGQSIFKKVLQNICYNKVLLRFCYTKDISKQFYNGVEIGHPMTSLVIPTNNRENIFEVTSFEHVVFCPSASASLERIYELASKNLSALFIVKSISKIKYKNVICQKYFDNYELVLNSCDYVYLPVSGLDRISGPLYEAIAVSKKVIVDRNDFGKQALAMFPMYVQFFDEPWVISSDTFDKDTYNKQVINKLRLILYGY
jgi:hypothetical protein